jgi:anti-sigma factor RsiW
MTTDEMACQELVEVITEYLEGKLPPADRERFEAHLTVCPGCQLYLDQMRAMARAMGRLSADNLTPQSQRELLSLFRNWKRA